MHHRSHCSSFFSFIVDKGALSYFIKDEESCYYHNKNFLHNWWSTQERAKKNVPICAFRTLISTDKGSCSLRVLSQRQTPSLSLLSTKREMEKAVLPRTSKEQLPLPVLFEHRKAQMKEVVLCTFFCKGKLILSLFATKREIDNVVLHPFLL